MTNLDGHADVLADGEKTPLQSLEQALKWSGRLSKRFTPSYRKLTVQRTTKGGKLTPARPRYELRIQPSSGSVPSWMRIYLGSATSITQKGVDWAVSTLDVRWLLFQSGIARADQLHGFSVSASPPQTRLLREDLLAWNGRGEEIGYTPSSQVDPERTSIFHPEHDDFYAAKAAEEAADASALAMADERFALHQRQEAINKAMWGDTAPKPPRAKRKARINPFPEGLKRMDDAWTGSRVVDGVTKREVFCDADYRDMRTALHDAIAWVTDNAKPGRVPRFMHGNEDPRVIVYRVSNTQHGHTALRYELLVRPTWGHSRMPDLRVSVGTLNRLKQQHLDNALATLRARWAAYLYAAASEPDLKPTQIDLSWIDVTGAAEQDRLTLDVLQDFRGGYRLKFETS
ncbi:MAG: hypothetical protein A2580_08985 [Hydrogenophilales bacterium RIFOXYD1_FULL_62_11]|nr:MAG: hypothetical protein A2580_08985 [Hydrogenophilales bacterium RIFOXYD1_FULL_62_11]